MKSTQLIKPYMKWNPIHSHPMKCPNERVFMDQDGIGHFQSILWEPLSELLDCGNHYLLRFELPGVDKNSLSLQYNNNWIILTGIKEYVSLTGHFCYTECHYGQFKKEIPVPSDVSKDGINATFENGILSVQLHKINSTEWITVQISSSSSSSQ